MFTYCNNNPVVLVDSSGKIPRSVTGAEYTDSVAWKKHRAAKILVRKTKITPQKVTKNEKTYTTFYATIDSENFAVWKDDQKQLSEITQYYAEHLYEEIENRKGEDDDVSYWLMSKNHIYSETMAHTTIWFAFGSLVPSTEVVNLNVDENRWKALIPMIYWGYDPSSDELP